MPRSRAIRLASGRGLHARPVAVRLRGRLRLRLGLLRGRFPAALAILVSLGRGLALFLAFALGDLGLVLDLGLLLLLRLRLGVGHVLALLADDRDRLADLDLLALAGQDLEQDARGVGLDLLGHLLRVELVERLALLDLVALGLQPAHDRPGLHALAEPRKRDLARHRYSLPTVRLTAASTSSACGMTYSSMTGANGIGANFAPTRSTGASR